MGPNQLAIELSFCSNIQAATFSAITRLSELTLNGCECVHNLNLLTDCPTLEVVHIDHEACRRFLFGAQYIWTSPLEMFKSDFGIDLAALQGFISLKGPASVKLGRNAQFMLRKLTARSERASRAALYGALYSVLYSDDSETSDSDEEE